MLFDTDVVVWLFRENEAAERLIEQTQERAVSIAAYMELVQGARNQREAREIRAFLGDLAFQMLPLTESVSYRAAVYMEEYALSSGIDIVDSLIAATAVERGLTLCTGNARHYRPVAELTLRPFRP
jgi:predicted nucleic acid-binding protein